MKRVAHSHGLLLIDDDEDCVFLTRRLLSKAGVECPVVVLSNGAQAIAHLRSTCLAAGGRRGMKPVAVLVDLNMPGAVNGFRVLQWARSRPAFRKVRFVVFSSSEDPRDLERAKELGADAYLVKFPTATDLIAALGPAIPRRPKPGPVGPPPPRRARRKLPPS